MCAASASLAALMVAAVFHSVLSKSYVTTWTLLRTISLLSLVAVSSSIPMPSISADRIPSTYMRSQRKRSSPAVGSPDEDDVDVAEQLTDDPPWRYRKRLDAAKGDGGRGFKPMVNNEVNRAVVKGIRMAHVVMGSLQTSVTVQSQKFPRYLRSLGYVKT
jgi:hypothetical protein